MKRIIKILIAAALIILILVFVLRGNDEKDAGEAEETATTAITDTFTGIPEEITDENEDPPGENINVTGSGEEEVSESQTEEPSETGTTEKAEIKNAWLDTSQMLILVNGNEYSMKDVTIGDLIDEGIEFIEDQNSKSPDDKVSPGHLQMTLIMSAGDYLPMYLTVVNDTEEELEISDCSICEISYTVADIEKTDLITFTFPESFTEDELKEEAGEPTEYYGYTDPSSGKEYHQYDYISFYSERYFLYTGYSFEFEDGELKTIHLYYAPE